MRMRLDTSQAALNVARSVMYSDAGFDVSRCGRYLALCELDPQVKIPLGFRWHPLGTFESLPMPQTQPARRATSPASAASDSLR